MSRRPLKQKLIWSTDAAWRKSTPAGVPVPGWPIAGAAHATPLPALFLPSTSPKLAPLPPGPLLVRDGLIPLLAFFAAYPRPPARFASRLLIHRDWAAYVPQAWRNRCRLYRIGSLPSPELLERPLPARSRTRGVFGFQISPDFCSLEHLTETVHRLSKIAAVKTACARSALGLFAGGPATFDYQIRAHLRLHSLLSRPPQLISWLELKHFTDLRDAFALDFNERLICADDANLHLLLSRGAVDPLAPRRLPDEKEFIRLSLFHGYFVSRFPARTPRFWESGGHHELLGYLSSQAGQGNRPPPPGQVPAWLDAYAKNRRCYEPVG